MFVKKDRWFGRGGLSQNQSSGCLLVGSVPHVVEVAAYCIFHEPCIESHRFPVLQVISR